MNTVRGRVRKGHVELDDPLPDGTEVVVLVVDGSERFDLDDSDAAELEARLAEADRGDLEPAEALFARLRPAR
jgi:hypothetical protein